jgi:hypothetical protein
LAVKHISAFVEAAFAVAVVSGLMTALWVLSVFEVEQAPSPRSRDVDDTDQVEKLLASVWETN